MMLIDQDLIDEAEQLHELMLAKGMLMHAAAVRATVANAEIEQLAEDKFGTERTSQCVAAISDLCSKMGDLTRQPKTVENLTIAVQASLPSFRELSDVNDAPFWLQERSSAITNGFRRLATAIGEREPSEPIGPDLDVRLHDYLRTLGEQFLQQREE